MRIHFRNLLNKNILLIISILIGSFFSFSVFAQHTRKVQSDIKKYSSKTEFPLGNTKLVSKQYNGRAAILINKKWGFIIYYILYSP